MTPDEVSQASCKGKPIDWWIPVALRGWTISQWRNACAKALAVCATCPVITPCAADALREGERHSVRGGMVPPEMSRIAPRRGTHGTPLRHGTESCYVHGCRLPECREAHAAYHRRLRAEKRAS